MKKKIIFFGDSITRFGVESGGYVDLLRHKLESAGLSAQFDLIGSGIGGNKIYDLLFRVESDVLIRQPDMVFVLIGVNDVWHKTNGTGTHLDTFKKFYAALIAKLQTAGIEVVLITPSCIGERKGNQNPMDTDLNLYCEATRVLTSQFNCNLLDFRSITQRFQASNNPHDVESGILTTDGVHLNQAGNQLLAEAVFPILFPEKP